MRKPIIIAVLSLSGFISSLVGADEIKLQDNPPQQYVVVKGDTLWGISSRFLKDPWRWPELWKMNREQIKNPHWIYPGDMVVLDMTGGSPHLRLVKGDQTVKLSPRVRSESIEARAIPAIPPSAIGPFMTQALILDDDALDDAPYIVGAEDNRGIMGQGDRIYAKDHTRNSETKNWSIIRKGKALLDPDTKETLGNEAEYVGEARTLQNDDVMTLEITSSVRETRRYDWLIPSVANRNNPSVPHAPEKSINGSIISAYGPSTDATKYQTVVINKGGKDGLEEGHVLAVYRKGRTVAGRTTVLPENAWRYSDKECVKEGKTISFDEFYDPKTLEPCQKKDGGRALGREVRYSDIGCLKPGAKISFDQFFNPKDVYKLHCRARDLDEAPEPETRSGLTKFIDEAVGFRRDVAIEPERRSGLIKFLDEMTGKIIEDDITLPDSRTGLLFVYRVFDRVSYALVMSSSRPVYLLDVVKNP